MSLRETIQTRLNTAKTSLGLATIGGAAHFAQVLEGSVSGRDMPGAYVWRVEVKADQNRLINAVRQRVTETIAIGIVVNHTVANNDGDSSDSCQTISESINANLLGFETGDYGMLTYRGGKLVNLDTGIYYWLDQYEAEYYVRAT